MSLKNCGSRPALRLEMWIILQRRMRRPKSRKLNEKRLRKDIKTARSGTQSYSDQYKADQGGQKKAKKTLTGSSMQLCKGVESLMECEINRSVEMAKPRKKKSSKS